MQQTFPDLIRTWGRKYRATNACGKQARTDKARIPRFVAGASTRNHSDTTIRSGYGGIAVYNLVDLVYENGRIGQSDGV